MMQYLYSLNVGTYPIIDFVKQIWYQYYYGGDNAKLFDELLFSTSGIKFSANYMLKVTWDQMAPAYPFSKLSEVIISAISGICISNKVPEWYSILRTQSYLVSQLAISKLDIHYTIYNFIIDILDMTKDVFIMALIII